jgi:hypothetical protein
MTQTTRATADVQTVVLERLQLIAQYARPRTAIAAYSTLIALGAFDTARRGPWRRLTELAYKSRPAVAAAAIRALVRARRAERRIPR